MWFLLLACSAPAPTPSAGPPPAPVEVAEVRRGQLEDSWTLLGEVRALERAELAAGADGPLTAVTVREGDRVAEGQLLAEVDPGLVLAELAAARADARRAQAEADQAHATLDRVTRVRGGVMAADEVDQARSRAEVADAALLRAQASVQLAGARLARHRVNAPFPGVVARRHGDPGDWVSPGAPLLDLVRLDPVEIVVDVPAGLAGAVAVGDVVQLGDAVGRVVGVVPSLDPTTRTSRIRVEPQGPFTPGSTVPVVFDVARSGGLVIPRDAVVPGPTDRVFRVVDGKAQAVEVEVVASTDDEVMVEAEGLSEGDALVVRGNERLRPDQPVAVQ